MKAKPTPVRSEQIYEEVGRKFRSRREHLRLTQDDVAQAVGLSRTSVTNIELGRQGILLHQLQRFAEVLRLDPRELVSGFSKPQRSLVQQSEVPVSVSELVAKIMSKS